MIKMTVTNIMPGKGIKYEAIFFFFNFFVTGTAYDSMSNSYENEYGGHQFYEWIYTFMGSEEAASVLNSQQSVSTSGQTSVQGNDTSVATNVQTQGTGAENLLVNPNWDNGIKGWEKTDSLEEELEDGKTALRSTVYQDISLSSEQAGAKVSYGGWICVTNAHPNQDQIRISLAFFSSDGTLLSYDSRAEYGYELAYHEINMSIPSEAAYMRASISIRKYDGNNDFSFNDLTLTVSQVNPGGFNRLAG